MNKRTTGLGAAALALGLVGATALTTLGASTARAEPDSLVYSRGGELSPGTQAPSLDAMVRTIENGGPEAVFATLEYGERVVCAACVPLLQNKLLSSDSARVREIAAWWLRRQPYATGPVLGWLKNIVFTSDDVVHRTRAAEALGEFMDTSALSALSHAALKDSSSDVRESGVLALGRLNMEAGTGIIAEAFADGSKKVRLAALSVVLKVNFFQEYDAVLPLLGDDDATVRQRSARLVGELYIKDAQGVLIAMLEGDPSVPARQAAAWSLGRLGTAAAQRALTAARRSEDAPAVLDAIRVAEQM